MKQTESLNSSITEYRDAGSLLKKAALFLILLLPFQRFPETIISAGRENFVLPIWANALDWIDESTFLLCLLMLIIFVFFMPEKYRLAKLPFHKWIGCFFLICILDIVVNKVPVSQGLFAIYNYLKNIAVIVLFAWLKIRKTDFKKFIRYIALCGIVLALGGIFGEIAALGFGKGIGILVDFRQRFGLYRVISFTGNGNWNYLGVYATLVFFLVHAVRKNATDYFILFLIGILEFLSSSRQAWLGFIVMFLAVIHINRKSKPIIALFVLILFLIAIPFYQDISATANMSGSLDKDTYFRFFAFLQSIQIFLSNPFFGVGPGMFGGITSIIFKSPIYSSWPAYFKDFAYKIHGIDQFWAGLWADTGLLGTVAFVMIFVSIFRYLRNASQFYKNNHNMEMARIGKVLYLFLVAIAIMCVGGGLNNAFVSFTYFALSGMYISLYLEDQEIKHVEN